MANASGASRELSLLFTCVGRRVELLQAFRAAAAGSMFDCASSASTTT